MSPLSLLVFGGVIFFFFSEEVHLLDIKKEKSTQKIVYCELFLGNHKLFLICSRVKVRRQTGFENLLQN